MKTYICSTVVAKENLSFSPMLCYATSTFKNTRLTFALSSAPMQRFGMG